MLLQDDAIHSLPNSSEVVAEDFKFGCSGNPTSEDSEDLSYIHSQSNKLTTSQSMQNVALNLMVDSTHVTNEECILSSTLVTLTKPYSNKQSALVFPSSHIPCKSKHTDKLAATNTKKSNRNGGMTEEIKCKIPSSPSAATKVKKHTAKYKLLSESCIPVNTAKFPSADATAHIVEAPIFHPNDKEFQDPIEYIEKIRSKAEKFGVCRIVPPSNFKPECKVSDDMRFTAYNQYVHKMLHRWGPNFKEFVAIKKYLKTQNIVLTHPPWVCLI